MNLIIISSDRSTYAVADLAAAIRCFQSVPTTIVAVGQHDFTIGPSEHYSVVQLKRQRKHHFLASAGFCLGLGLEWAISEEGPVRCQDLEQVFLLQDTCLLLAPGFDAWIAERFRRAGAGLGLLGVQTRDSHRVAANQIEGFFSEWDVPGEPWEQAPDTLGEDALMLSGPLVAALAERCLLVPEGYRQWPYSYGDYLSWVAFRLGFAQIAWGHADRQLPPLFINNPLHGYQVAPHLLQNQFLLYSSVRKVYGYTEEMLREAYKRMRGEPAREIEPIRPTVSGPALEGVNLL